MTERLIGVREAAGRLGMTAKELRAKCQTGTSPVRFSKRGDGPKAVWVCLESELDAYIKGLFAEPQAVAG